MKRVNTVFRRVLRRPTGLVGAILVALMVLTALVSLVWTPHDPMAVNPADSWAPFSAEHPLGADALGRDTMSRLMVGSQLTLITAVGSVALATVIGLLLGGLIVFVPRSVAVLLERMVDLMVAFPTLLVAIIIATATKGATWGLIVAIGIGSISTITRTILPELRRSIRSDHVTLARTTGAGPWWLLRAHIFPDVAATLLVRMTQLLGVATLAEAGLSYLGLGAPLATPSWGRMLADHQNQIYQRPEVLIAPALVIVLAILAFNLLGDALRDAMDARED